MASSSDDDDEFGDFDFITSAATRNQAEFKAKTPIRRERECSSSFSSIESVSDEETTENHDVSVIQILPNTSHSEDPTPTRRIRGRPRRKYRTPRRSNKEDDSIILIDEDVEETSSKSVQDAEEEEKTIKVLWNYEIYRISVPTGGKIRDLCERISSKVSVPLDNIILYLNDNLLHKDSSVDDIKVIDIVSAYQGTATESYLELKVQRGNSRQSIMTVKVKESDTVGQLLDAYISAVKDDGITKDGGLSLMFDGEVLKQEDLLKDLDLEGGECFDLVVPKAPVSSCEPVTKSRPRRSRRRR